MVCEPVAIQSNHYHETVHLVVSVFHVISVSVFLFIIVHSYFFVLFCCVLQRFPSY